MKDERETALLSDLKRENVFDFWSDVSLGAHTDIMTSLELRDQLMSWLEKHNLEWTVMISDVQSLIELEKIPPTSSSAWYGPRHYMDWVQYHSQASIHGWFNYLVQRECDFCSTETIGKSSEGRDMKVFKVRTLKASECDWLMVE